MQVGGCAVLSVFRQYNLVDKKFGWVGWNDSPSAPPFAPDPASSISPLPLHAFGLGSSPTIMATLITKQRLKIRPYIPRAHTEQVLLFIVTSYSTVVRIHKHTKLTMVAIAGRNRGWGGGGYICAIDVCASTFVLVGFFLPVIF